VESHGTDDAVNVSAAAWEIVSQHFEGKSLGLVPLKGKGDMEIFEIIASR
jgi:hypothetical protein